MGGRVEVGITTLLTIMFLLCSVNTALPRVSYAKAIDWYLIVSFLFVFLVLLECTLVYILRPKNKQSKDQTGDKSVDLEGGMTEVSKKEGNLVYNATGLLLLIITFGALQRFRKHKALERFTPTVCPSLHTGHRK